MHPAQLSASPSGERIAFTAVTDQHTARVCWVQVATAHLECLPSAAATSRPTFASNDHDLYYDASDGIRRHDILSGTDELVLAHVRGFGGLAAPSDGRAIVLSTCTARSDIEDASTSPPKVVIDDGFATNPAVAADGMLFYVRAENHHPIAVARFPDGKTVQLTSPDLPGLRDLSASPNGETIAFVEPQAGIRTHKTETGGYPQPLTDNPRDDGPRWLDDETIAFTRTDEHDVPSVYVVSRHGGPATRVVAGKRLLAAGGRRVLIESNDRHFWLNVATRAERTVTELPQLAMAALSPSGHWVAFITGGSGQAIWRKALDTPGAKPEHVMDLAKGQTNESLAITDEGHVLVTPSTWSGDLLVVPAAAGTRF
jgi:hypothetical protein